jgi:hypothetical protein
VESSPSCSVSLVAGCSSTSLFAIEIANPQTNIINHMSRSHASTRAAQRAHLKCEVQRCSDHVDGLSRYCKKHKQNNSRHGDPNGRAIRVYELNPYIKQARKFLKANIDHPALVASYNQLDDFLAEGARQAGLLSLEVARTWRGRLALECKRLHDATVTGHVIFERLLAIWLLSGADPRRLPRHSKPFRFAVARAVFNLADRYGSRVIRANNKAYKITKRLSTELLDNAGRDIIVSFVHVLMKIEEALGERERRERERRETLAAAVEAKAFASV